MKILIVVNEFPPGPGGVGTHAHALAQQLAKLGHSIHVVCEQLYSDINKSETFNKKQEFSIYPYPRAGGYWARLTSRIRLVYKVLKAQSPEFVLVSGSNSVWIGALFRILFRSFKLVVVVHGGELTFKPWIRSALTRLGCRAADQIISVSNYTRNLLPPALLSRTVVIHNGADNVLFFNQHRRTELKTKYNLSGKRVLLTVGSVSHRKGQDIVIRALKSIHDVYPDVVYVMAGRSNDLEFFQGVAREENVTEQVRFMGTVTTDQLTELYNLTDLYVITSRHSREGDFEGFGISVIEAALCGNGAVVTQDSGLIEAIEEGITGASIPPEDPEALSRKVVELFKQDTVTIMGVKAQQRAEADFTWSKVASKYHQLLLGVQ